ncbi:MAG: WYL domain-containing protein, partial [Acidimicrobiia bacterium]
DPHGILFRHGHWYLIGHDHGRGEARSFRLDRIEGSVEAGPPGSFEAPPGFDPTEALAVEPWRFGTETPIEARVLVDSRLAAWASNELGDEAIVERREEGSVVVSLSVTNREAFRSFVLGLLDAAVVLEPPTLLADLLGWLGEIADGGIVDATHPTATAAASTAGRQAQPELQPGVSDAPVKARRADSAGRLRRLLAIIPWIVEHQGSSLEEIAARFGLEVRQLERDLELVPFCGLPPYTPDRLIDLAIVDGMVTVRFAEYLAAPLRLTPAEGFALLAAGRGLLAVPGSDPDGALAGALGKLGKVLGESGGIAIDLDPGRYLSPLQDAVAAGERVELEYYSFGRDALTRRAVDPYRVFAQAGEWYLEAYCHLAGDERLFRIDRIRSLERRGDFFELPAGRDPAGEIYRPRPFDPRVVLVLPLEARWVVESYPTEGAETLADGSLRVVLAVSQRGWLERLLLRVGPRGYVLSPPELVGLAQEAAARLLRLYGHRSADTAREDGN